MKASARDVGNWHSSGAKALAAGLALVCLLGAAPAFATIGLKTKFAEVAVKNLKIGKTYSLQDLVNLPLRVTNTGTDALELEVTPWQPRGDEMKKGFEAIPDADWVHLSLSTFTVYPSMDAVTDVVISVPNDEKLLGRRFLVYLWTRSRNPLTFGVGLKSRLLIFVSSEKPTDEELKQKFVPKRLANLNFSFAPMEVAAVNVPVGKKVTLKDFKADLKLSNPNDTGYHFKVTPVGLWETEITPLAGFEPVRDPKWLIVPKPVFAAEGFTFTPLDLQLQIPDTPEHRGKGFMLIVRAEILEQDIPAYAYGKIFVTTEK